MSSEPKAPGGPDLAKGVQLADLKDGKLLGHVGEEEVLLVRGEDGIFAVGAHCSHYHGPLVEGLVVKNSVRCPWHHACFNLRTGEAVRAPAFSPLPTWEVEVRNGQIFVKEKKKSSPQKYPAPDPNIKNIVIIGAGAAGFAAAEMLRRRFPGRIVIFGAEASAPIDRPNLSKDYLAGSAPEKWLPLKPKSFYENRNIELRLNTEIERIDVQGREVIAKSGETTAYDRLLLATGSEALRIPVPGADEPYVFTLRSLADSQAIIKAAESAKKAFIIGASFIGLETAAALRARNIEVHVVAPEKRPMERVFGPEMGDFIRRLHEEHGVIFHLGENVVSLLDRKVRLQSGAAFDADLVILGVGVRPRLALAKQAGLTIDNGVVVDKYLRSSVPEIYAAGDIARWPDRHSKSDIRVEHWVVAERQGQTAAINMLGGREEFDAVPFFWSQHYDIPINYVGHAENWDRIELEGNIGEKDCVLKFLKGGEVRAVASIFRDKASLEAELQMEKESRSPAQV